MSNNGRNTRNWLILNVIKTLITGVVLIVIFYFFCTLFPSGGSAIIKSLGLEFKKTDFQEAVKEILKNQEQTEYAIDELTKNEDNLSLILKDDRLLKCLAKQLPEYDNEDSRKRSKRLNKLINDKIFIKELRELATSHKPPFQYVGTIVKIGVPDKPEYQPKTFHVRPAKESKWQFQRIRIKNPNLQNRYVILQAYGGHDEKEYPNNFNLNREQANYLFDIFNDRTREAIAIIEPSPGELVYWDSTKKHLERIPQEK